MKMDQRGKVSRKHSFSPLVKIGIAFVLTFSLIASSRASGPWRTTPLIESNLVQVSGSPTTKPSSTSTTPIPTVITPTLTLTATVTVTSPVIQSTPQNVTPIPTPTVIVVSQQDLIEVYKSLAEASGRAVETAQSTLNLVLLLATLVGGILVTVGIRAVINAQEANRQAKEAHELAQNFTRFADNADKEVKILQESIDSLNKSLTEGVNRIERLSHLQDELQVVLENQRQQIESDTRILERLYTEAEVDRYAMNFFGDDATRQTSGRKGLLHLSRNSNPIIRRECLQVFNVMPNYLENWIDREILARIDHMMHHDEERRVRKEAEAVITKWQELGGRQINTLLNKIRADKS